MIFNPIEERTRLSELVSCILGQHVTVIEVFPNANSAFLNSFVIMDMVVRLDDGSITNIEIQKVPYDFPAARITCYSADLVLRQFRMLQGMTKKNENDEYMENRGKYKDRIDTELDIYFDGNYEVAGGLGSTIVADEWEKYEKN